MTRSLLCLVACLAISGCTGTPEPDVRSDGLSAGCVDGFGAIQAGTTICVGYGG